MQERGFSLVQLLVVVAILVVLLLIALPRFLPVQRFATEDGASKTMEAALREAVSTATTGPTTAFSPTSVVGMPAGVEVDCTAFPAPDGTTAAPEFFLRGGIGTPLLAAREGDSKYPANVAVIVSATDRSWASALVVNTAGIVSRYDWRNERWVKH